MTLTILNHKFSVSGVCRPECVVRFFVPLKTLQKLNRKPDRVTIMFIKASPEANVEEEFQQLSREFPGHTLIRASDSCLLLADTRLLGLNEFRVAPVLVSALLSLMVVLSAMYPTVFEHTREIGILISLGAYRRFIIGMISKESAMICCLGALLGIGVSEIIRKRVITRFPALQVSMSFHDLIRGLVLGLFARTLGALISGMQRRSNGSS